MNRDNSLDFLRIILTILVVVHHVAMVYGGASGWYWKELTDTNIYLVSFNSINQSFFMGFFFMLAGYFSVPSIEKKGSMQFMLERMIRLGIPLVVYLFVLSPATVAVANEAGADASFFQIFQYLLRENEFEPGPLWFLLALLIFSSIFSVFYRFFPNGIPEVKVFPNALTMFFVLLSLGVAVFFVRLNFPTNLQVLWLIIGFFPSYVLCYLFGIASYRNRLLQNANLPWAGGWIAISSILAILFPVVLFNPIGSGLFEGGLNVNALFYALWEPFVAWGIILGLIKISRSKLIANAVWIQDLAPLMFGVFIVHPLIIVIVSKALSTELDAIFIKLPLNAFISVILSLAASWCLRKIPLSNKVL